MVQWPKSREWMNEREAETKRERKIFVKHSELSMHSTSPPSEEEEEIKKKLTVYSDLALYFQFDIELLFFLVAPILYFGWNAWLCTRCVCVQRDINCYFHRLNFQVKYLNEERNERTNDSERKRAYFCKNGTFDKTIIKTLSSNWNKVLFHQINLKSPDFMHE